MNKKILVATTLTLLLAGQTAMAQDDAEEFLSWLDNPNNIVEQVSKQPLRFDRVSIKHYNAGDTTYKAEEDVFSIDYMSNN